MGTTTHWTECPNDRWPTEFSPRLSTTVTLVAVATCMIVATWMVSAFKVPTPTTQSSLVSQADSISTVRIVDPAFCQNQTWPYIDERCLKRSGNPPLSATSSPATGSSEASTRLSETAGSEAITGSGTEGTTLAQPNPLSGTRVETTQADEIQREVPSTEGIILGNSSVYQQQPESPHRTSQHHHRVPFFFGFRF
jgi:hypothetical protein